VLGFSLIIFTHVPIKPFLDLKETLPWYKCFCCGWTILGLHVWPFSPSVNHCKAFISPRWRSWLKLINKEWRNTGSTVACMFKMARRSPIFKNLHSVGFNSCIYIVHQCWWIYNDIELSIICIYLTSHIMLVKIYIIDFVYNNSVHQASQTQMLLESWGQMKAYKVTRGLHYDADATMAVLEPY